MSKIIDKFIEGSLNSSQIIFSTHYERRVLERELDRPKIVNMIINEDYLDFYEDLNKKNSYLIHFPSDKKNYDIANLLECSAPSYCERLKRNKLSNETLNKIAKYLGCEVEITFIFPDGTKI